MIVVDTTLLVYAVGSTHPLRDPSRDLFALVRDGSVRATTTVEVIQEFTHVRARRRTRADAADVAKAFATGLSPLLRPDDDDLAEGLELFRSSKRLGPLGAVLAATARRRGHALASADHAFRHIDGLVTIDPAARTYVDDLHAAG